MKSLLLSKKTEQTSSSLNLKSITKAKKHFQKFKEMIIIMIIIIIIIIIIINIVVKLLIIIIIIIEM